MPSKGENHRESPTLLLSLVIKTLNAHFDDFSLHGQNCDTDLNDYGWSLYIEVKMSVGGRSMECLHG